ncbi:MAG: hypothetical protein E6I79_00105 [Chloroflexi bacterium]|nr:MAG: hypothetical protein E6I79_00105 [Chloroflexota bacterium]
MRQNIWKRWKTTTSPSLYLKYGATLLLLLFSVLIVSCGGGATNANLGQPDVTVTINLGQGDGSPTPPLPGYTCSAWVTNTSPSMNKSSIIGVYAKFVHNVNGNPQGVYPAQGTATVLWAEGSVNVTANTTSDGLAIFPVSIANKSADLNKIVLVTIAFQGPQGVPPCNVTIDRAAFFTLVISTPNTKSTAPVGGSPTVNPPETVTATYSPTTIPSPTQSPKPCPTVKPLRTPTPCP